MEIVRSSVTFQSLESTTPLGRLVDPYASLHGTARKRILIFESDDQTSALIAETLKNGFASPSPVITSEDEPSVEFLICSNLDEVLLHVDDTASSGDALSSALASPFDLIIWGLSSPFESGVSIERPFELSLQYLHRVRELLSDARLILVAPQEALAFAPSIKTLNVDSFLLKPLRPQDLRTGVDRALRKPRLSTSISDSPSRIREIGHFSASDFTIQREDVRAPSAEARVTRVPASLLSNDAISDGKDLGLIGSSPEMRKIVSLIRRVGTSSVNVLITGESGTGKEMVASAIHKVSDRRNKPFIAINCAAIPRELLESELFGHAKGAFTGATVARRGLFEEANEGTLLLDEIGDLPMSLQAKILRVLQTRQVKPLGQNTVREVDVRIISATHKNLKELIKKGEFREDLYYRLNVMPIHLPPLRERKDDILQLAEYFLKRYAETGKGPLRTLTRKACTKLSNLPWKGNVRELENVIERAIVLSDDGFITDNEIMSEEVENVNVSAEDLFNSGLSLKDIEREYIKYVLSRTGNRKEAATRILGIDRKTLYRKEKLYGIRPTDMN